MPEPPNEPPITCEAPPNVIAPLGPNCVELPSVVTAIIPDAAPNSILVLYAPLLTMAGAYTLPAVIKLPPVTLPLKLPTLPFKF